MAYFSLDRRHRPLHQVDRAIGSFERAIQRDPDDISIRNHLALACEDGSHRAGAIARWRIVRDQGRRRRNPVCIDRAERHLRALGTVPDPPRDLGDGR